MHDCLKMSYYNGVADGVVNLMQYYKYMIMRVPIGTSKMKFVLEKSLNNDD